ncbi:MAG: hypothetical protein IKP06_03100 [Elusimicrobiaceae bacterium]|nr:hypothetical protein [Elusimicrobiaceae bacterium]
MYKRGAKCLRERQGQATVEYILMLATIVVVLSAFLTAFHTDIVRFFFTFIGQLLMS